MKRNSLFSYAFTLVLGVSVAWGPILIGPRDAAAAGGSQVVEKGVGQHSADHTMHHRGYGRHRYGRHHEKSKLLGPDWKSTLTDEQRTEIDGLTAVYAKDKSPLKARARVLKVELAVLATADAPDMAAIERKIAELLELKSRMMRRKAEHIASKRNVLNPEQRPSFDMEVLMSARHLRERRRSGHH